MSPRDARAITFSVVTAVALLAVSFLVFRNLLASFALFAAYAVFILTRPRMRRIRRRMRRDPSFSDYYQN